MNFIKKYWSLIIPLLFGILLFANSQVVKRIDLEPTTKEIPVETATSPATPTVIPTPKITPAAPEIKNSSFITLINRERLNAGVEEVIEAKNLDAGAYQRATDLFTSNQWSHDGFVEAIDKFLITNERVKIGEDLARYQSSEEEVVRAWLNSPTHKEVMLDPVYHYAGTGHYQTYWVLWLSAKP